MFVFIIILQLPLDYINGIFNPPIEDIKILPGAEIVVDEFFGVYGTHYLARKTMKLLQKFTEPNWKL